MRASLPVFPRLRHPFAFSSFSVLIRIAGGCDASNAAHGRINYGGIRLDCSSHRIFSPRDRDGDYGQEPSKSSSFDERATFAGPEGTPKFPPVSLMRTETSQYMVRQDISSSYERLLPRNGLRYRSSVRGGSCVLSYHFTCQRLQTRAPHHSGVFHEKPSKLAEVHGRRLFNFRRKFWRLFFG